MLLTVLLAASPGKTVVAIDPGHGGEQPGATGVCGILEKKITLQISTEVTRLLETSGRVSVLRTRTDDTDVPLEERASLANEAGAALFVSIHANASTNADSRGTETFFLSRRASNRRIGKLADRENRGVQAVPELEDELLSQILGGLLLNAAHFESQRLAIRIQEGLNGRIDTRGRGVLQAPFIVLLNAQMPAALVEVGFITHEEECNLLATGEYRRSLAKSIAAAILEHVINDNQTLGVR